MEGVWILPAGTTSQAYQDRTELVMISISLHEVCKAHIPPHPAGPAARENQPVSETSDRQGQGRVLTLGAADVGGPVAKEPKVRFIINPWQSGFAGGR